MSVRISEEDILSLQADAAVIGVEIAMDLNDSPVCTRLAEAAGPALAASARAQRFLAAGSACPGSPARRRKCERKTRTAAMSSASSTAACTP